MANPDHFALLKQGVEAWNKWRQAPRITAIWAIPCIRPNLHWADLREADLGGADFGEADLGGADLRKADLRGASLFRADLRGAILDSTRLRRAILGGADLRGAYLHRADLFEANLNEADLRGADLREADLGGADLRKADLREASLFRADLREADLGGANFMGADLREADLRGATLWETTLSGVALSEVKGLDTCRHEGPSLLDFRTLQQSGSLPLAFLRGCGLPDLVINYLPSLLNQPIQFYSCFISYSSKDEDFAQRLHADLQNKGVRCWFAPEDIEGGKKLYEQIGEAIRLHEKLLLVLSKHSMNSKWVKTEIAKARQREEREKRQVLFPIRLVDFKTIQGWECFDADIGTDSAREIREYFIPDFSNWKNHDAYQHAFDRLIRDLKLALERKPETT